MVTTVESYFSQFNMYIYICEKRPSSQLEISSSFSRTGIPIGGKRSTIVVASLLCNSISSPKVKKTCDLMWSLLLPSADLDVTKKMRDPLKEK